MHSPERSGPPAWVILGILTLVAGLVWLYLYVRPNLGGQPAQATATSAAPAHLSQACIDTIRLARLVGRDVGPLTHAANGHVNVMELLKLTIDGKPGGIDGQEAFRRSEPQMQVMARYGPDAEIHLQAFKRASRKCPIK
jgi:hypothetical protein